MALPLFRVITRRLSDSIRAIFFLRPTATIAGRGFNDADRVFWRHRENALTLPRPAQSPARSFDSAFTSQPRSRCSAQDDKVSFFPIDSLPIPFCGSAGWEWPKPRTSTLAIISLLSSKFREHCCFRRIYE